MSAKEKITHTSNRHTHAHKHTPTKGADRQTYTQEAHTSCGRWTIHPDCACDHSRERTCSSVSSAAQLWWVLGLILISVISTGRKLWVTESRSDDDMFTLLSDYPCDDGSHTVQPKETNLYWCTETMVLSFQETFFLLVNKIWLTLPPKSCFHSIHLSNSFDGNIKFVSLWRKPRYIYMYSNHSSQQRMSLLTAQQAKKSLYMYVQLTNVEWWRQKNDIQYIVSYI